MNSGPYSGAEYIHPRKMARCMHLISVSDVVHDVSACIMNVFQLRRIPHVDVAPTTAKPRVYLSK